MSSVKIKKPVKKGVAKVPVIMQMEALECGAASMAMILSYYGRWIPLEQAREDCGVSRDGSNARNVLRAARGYGMEASGFRMEADAIFTGEFDLPCIAHWEYNHFVVVDGFKGNKVYINDPARGLVVMSRNEFKEGYSGICLRLVPGENFEPGGKRAGMTGYIKKTMKGAIPAAVFSVIITGIISLAGIMNNGVSRFFMDYMLPGKNDSLLYDFCMTMLLIIAIQLVCSYLKDIYMLRLEGKMTVYGSSSYIWRVLRLPMSFFSQRLAGDIQQRQMLHTTIANQLMGKLAPIVLNVCITIFYLVVMLRYSPFLTAVGVGGIFINFIAARIAAERKLNVSRVMLRDEGLLDSTTVSGIEMIETIKASGAENGFFQRWAFYHDSVNSQNLKALSLELRYSAIPKIITDISSYAVLFVGVGLMIRGQFTAGMIFAFQGYLSSFMSPLNSLIGAGTDIQEMRSQMERIEDVMKYPIDKSCERLELSDDNTEYEKLSGQVSLKNVTFGYSKFARPLISDFSMELKPGSSVAFVGASGCGKSTLTNLISGLYRPWSGEILFDGKSIDEIDHGVFTGSVSVVDQEIIIFEDTIANNIKMWDSTIADFEMIMAARDASIHEDIMKRDGGYNHKLSENGKNLSGGQRQRLEIARVLAQDPTIVIMDEATSALDAKTEYRVMKSIRDRGVTCIVVAHRLSTIRDCDEIIVLDDGEVVARGTHEELMKSCEYYNELVSSE